MRLPSAVSAVVIIAALASPAVGQEPPRPQPPVSPPPFSRAPAPLDRQYEMSNLARRYDWEAFLANNAQATSWMDQQSLERIDRANRISGMIERGLCDEARALANAEGDRTMALRVRELC